MTLVQSAEEINSRDIILSFRVTRTEKTQTPRCFVGLVSGEKSVFHLVASSLHQSSFVPRAKHRDRAGGGQTLFGVYIFPQTFPPNDFCSVAPAYAPNCLGGNVVVSEVMMYGF